MSVNNGPGMISNSLHGLANEALHMIADIASQLQQQEQGACSNNPIDRFIPDMSSNTLAGMIIQVLQVTANIASQLEQPAQEEQGVASNYPIDDLPTGLLFVQFL